MDPDAQLQAPLAPATASIPRRVLGWSIDYTIVMVPGLTLVTLALVGMVHALPGYIGAVGADVGWSGLVRLIVHHGGGRPRRQGRGRGRVDGVRPAADRRASRRATPPIRLPRNTTVLARPHHWKDRDRHPSRR